jgi:hypothetical protein
MLSRCTTCTISSLAAAYTAALTKCGSAIDATKDGHFKRLLADWRAQPELKNAFAYEFTLEDRQLGGRTDASLAHKVSSAALLTAPYLARSLLHHSYAVPPLPPTHRSRISGGG